MFRIYWVSKRPGKGLNGIEEDSAFLGGENFAGPCTSPSLQRAVGVLKGVPVSCMKASHLACFTYFATKRCDYVWKRRLAEGGKYY